jgi:S1-C subfamily serine protease
LVGFDVLRHFVLTFDQKKKRVRMQPVSKSPVRMKARTGTGALLRPRENSLEVARIVPGSSAEDAGLKPGDKVTHVDGVPVNERGCRDMRQRDDYVEYTFRRDSAEQTVRVERTVLLQ